MSPDDLRYAESHEWVALEDGIATVGITDFAVKQLTDLVYVDLPKPGTKFEAGAVFGEVESVKAASDLYAPVGGEVTEVNADVPDDPGILSDDPFGKGWLVKLKVDDSSALEKLLDRAAYQEHCAREDH